MTEEQAREAAKQTMIASLMQNPQNLDDVFNTLWNAAIEYANRWTYCEDALPKVDGDYEVTVYCNFGKRTFAHWSMWGGKWDIEGESFSYKVIAWREMPEPAKR